MMTQSCGSRRLIRSVSWSTRAKYLRASQAQTDWTIENATSPEYNVVATELIESGNGSNSSPEEETGRKKKDALTSFRLIDYYRNGPRLILRLLMRGCLIPDELRCTGCHHQEEWEENDEHEVHQQQQQHSPLDDLHEDLWLECLARVPRSALQASMMVCQKWRRSLNSEEFYKVRRNLGRVEDLLFVFGGVGTELASAVFSKSTGGWKAGFLGTLRALEGKDRVIDFFNADRCFLHTQPAVIKHKIYILGAMFYSCSASESSRRFRGVGDGVGGVEGRGGEGRGGAGGRACTLIYNTWTKTLTRQSPMSVPRKKFATCVINDRIYVAGGSSRDDSCGEMVLTAEVYVPQLDIWKPLPNMPKKRYACIGAAANGIFYVIGGLNCRLFSSGQPQYVCSMDSFNPKTNSWQKTTKLPIVGCVIACTVVDNCIYMLSSMAVELSLWKYDPRGSQDGMAGTFSKIKPPPIPSPLRIDSCLKFSCVTIGKSVFIVQVGGSIDDLLRRSGRRERGLKEGLVIVYDTVTEEWSRGPDMPFVKNGANCAVVMC